jgi:acetate kinase
MTGINDILTINAGSSSIKIALFSAGQSLRPVLTASVEQIGTPGSHLSVRDCGDTETLTRPVAAGTFPEAVAFAINWIGDSGWSKGVTAVVHRIVHGGPDFHLPKRLTRTDVEALRRLVPLDPEHLPGAILLIEAITRRFPLLPQFACFDTGFHHDMPGVAKRLAIPRKFDVQGVRRYGFHGISYEYLMSELLRTDGDLAARGRIVLAHLGNGSSLAAVSNGKPVDTSMGFTPAAGVPMGTRSGDLDPGLALYMARTQNMDAQQFDNFVNFECGLLGVSGTSSDMRELLGAEDEDPRAAEAIALYCYQIKKCIGAFAAALGGLDTLVFTGGIGANASPVRARICEGLAFLGVELDRTRNQHNATVVSKDAAKVKVRAMQTDEELVMARTVMRLLDCHA